MTQHWTILDKRVIQPTLVASRQDHSKLAITASFPLYNSSVSQTWILKGYLMFMIYPHSYKHSLGPFDYSTILVATRLVNTSKFGLLVPN